MIIRKRLFGCMGVLALMATVTACSSSSHHASSTSSSAGSSGTASSNSNNSTASSAPATGSPIKVGVICSCTSPLGGESAGSGDASKAWAKSVNASGGLDGHPVDLIFFDDASNPGNSLTDAQTLISDHVAVISDISLEDSTWEKPVDAAKIPVVGGYQSAPLGTDPNFYPATQTFGSSLYSQVYLGKEAGATSAGIVACTEAATCAAEAAIFKAAGKKLNIPIKYNTLVSATAPNYTAQCLAAKEAGVEALALDLEDTTAQAFATNCGTQGYAPIYLEPDASWKPSEDSSAFGKNAWVNFTSLPYFANTPAVQTMNAALDKYYPGLRQKTESIWNEEATGGWIAGLLIRDALKNSGVGHSATVTAAAMTRGLDSIKNDTLDGWAPPLTFTAGQPHTVNCWFTVKVANGSPTVMNNGRSTCEAGSAS